jgi:hypothetical protein
MKMLTLYLPHTVRKAQREKRGSHIAVLADRTFGKDTVKRALFITDFPRLIAANELNLTLIIHPLFLNLSGKTDGT